MKGLVAVFKLVQTAAGSEVADCNVPGPVHMMLMMLLDCVMNSGPSCGGAI